MLDLFAIMYRRGIGVQYDIYLSKYNAELKSWGISKWVASASTLTDCQAECRRLEKIYCAPFLGRMGYPYTVQDYLEKFNKLEFQ